MVASRVRWFRVKVSDHSVVRVMSGVGHAAIVSVLDGVSDSLVLTTFVRATDVSLAAGTHTPLDATFPRLSRRVDTVLETILKSAWQSALSHLDASLARSKVSPAETELTFDPNTSCKPSDSAYMRSVPVRASFSAHLDSSSRRDNHHGSLDRRAGVTGHTPALADSTTSFEHEAVVSMLSSITYRLGIELLLVALRLQVSTVDDEMSVHDPIEDPQGVHVAATQPWRCCNRRRRLNLKGLSKVSAHNHLKRRMKKAGVQSFQLSFSRPRWLGHLL